MPQHQKFMWDAFKEIDKTFADSFKEVTDIDEESLKFS